MAITSGFYNSVGNDRLYTAEQLSSIFEGLITDGIYNKVGGALQVQSAGSGMTLTVATGRAWLNGAWIKNDAVHIIEIESSEVALSRYDAIVLRTDFSDDTRDGGIYVKKGVASSSPAYPELTESEYIKEIPIAYVYVGKNVSEITQSNITDMRGSANCPWVTAEINAPLAITAYPLKITFALASFPNLIWLTLSEVTPSSPVTPIFIILR